MNNEEPNQQLTPSIEDGSGSADRDTATPTNTTGPASRSITPGVIRHGLELVVDLNSPMDKSLLKPNHGKLIVLRQTNYHVWAQTHQRFLSGRGIFGIAAGTLPLPRNDEEPSTTNWLIFNSWIINHLSTHVEEHQQTHIASLRTAKAVWDELQRIHGVSGKGRLAPMLQRFSSYTKGSDESIDKMATALRQLCDEIANLAPQAKPNDSLVATIIMNACQGEEYAMAKHTLNQLDWEELTPARVVEQLRGVEQEIRQKDSAHLAAQKTRGGGKQGKPSRSKGTDKSEVECYNCGKKGHYKSECSDLEDKGDEGDQGVPLRPKIRRNESSKFTSRRPRQRERAAVAAEDDQITEDPEDDSGTKERVWMAVHRRDQSMVIDGWLIDSGATRHMTPQRELFTAMISYHGVVEFGNRGELPVRGKGDIRVKIGRHV